MRITYSHVKGKRIRNKNAAKGNVGSDEAKVRKMIDANEKSPIDKVIQVKQRGTFLCRERT